MNTVLETAAFTGATVEVFEGKVLDGERYVQEYESLVGVQLQSQVKRAILVKNAPEEVRHHIHSPGTKLGGLRLRQGCGVGLLQARPDLGDAGAVERVDLRALAIGAMTENAKAKGKGKSKSMGESKSNGKGKSKDKEE